MAGCNFVIANQFKQDYVRPGLVEVQETSVDRVKPVDI